MGGGINNGSKLLNFSHHFETSHARTVKSPVSLCRPALSSATTSNLRQAQDFYFREARRLGYVARSAFKLLELQSAHRLIPKGGNVLDLGCVPGAWLQVACQALGPPPSRSSPTPSRSSPTAKGCVVGVDLVAVDVGSLRHTDARVKTLVGDIFGLRPASVRALLPPGATCFDAVLGDAAPATTGSADVDCARSAKLALAAASLALDGDDRLLKPGGCLLLKLLEGGSGRRELGDACAGRFTRVLWARPKATRASSREVFLVGLGLRRDRA